MVAAVTSSCVLVLGHRGVRQMEARTEVQEVCRVGRDQRRASRSVGHTTSQVPQITIAECCCIYRIKDRLRQEGWAQDLAGMSEAYLERFASQKFASKAEALTERGTYFFASLYHDAVVMNYSQGGRRSMPT